MQRQQLAYEAFQWTVSISRVTDTQFGFVKLSSSLQITWEIWQDPIQHFGRRGGPLPFTIHSASRWSGGLMCFHFQKMLVLWNFRQSIDYGNPWHIWGQIFRAGVSNSVIGFSFWVEISKVIKVENNSLRIHNIFCLRLAFESLRITGILQLGLSELHYYAEMVNNLIRWTFDVQRTWHNRWWYRMIICSAVWVNNIQTAPFQSMCIKTSTFETPHCLPYWTFIFEFPRGAQVLGIKLRSQNYKR